MEFGIEGAGVVSPPAPSTRVWRIMYLELPIRPFLYTTDQIATLLRMDQSYLEASLLYFQGRSVGSPSRDLIQVNNIAPSGVKPEWRASEQELMRWMRRKGFKVRTTTWTST